MISGPAIGQEFFKSKSHPNFAKSAKLEWGSLRARNNLSGSLVTPTRKGIPEMKRLSYSRTSRGRCNSACTISPSPGSDPRHRSALQNHPVAGHPAFRRLQPLRSGEIRVIPGRRPGILSRQDWIESRTRDSRRRDQEQYLRQSHQRTCSRDTRGLPHRQLRCGRDWRSPLPSSRTRGSRLVGEAKFIHLWQNKDGVWKITRVISFDHQSLAK